MSPPRHLGLDLGGTNIKVAVLERDDPASPPRLVASSSVLTLADRGPEAVASTMVEAGRAAIDASGPVATVGIGVPGLFDPASGVIERFPNLAGPWAGFPIRTRITEGLGLPVAMINDARAHTLAEHRMGAGRGVTNMVLLTLGTGIGGGIIIDGELYLGTAGSAGEIGHQTIDPDGPVCGCGNRGCVEAYAQAGAITQAAGRDTVEAVIAGADEGDARCQAALDRAIEHLGIGIANMVTILVPDRVVVGGGISNAGDAIMVPLREAIQARIPFVPHPRFQLDVRRAALGSGAGAIGAALAGAEAR